MLLLGMLLLLAEIKHCFECFLLDCFHQSDEKKWYVFWLIYLENNCASSFMCVITDSKVHGANMGPTWVLSAPDGLPCWPHESWVCHISICLIVTKYWCILMDQWIVTLLIFSSTDLSWDCHAFHIFVTVHCDLFMMYVFCYHFTLLTQSPTWEMYLLHDISLGKWSTVRFCTLHMVHKVRSLCNDNALILLAVIYYISQLFFVHVACILIWCRSADDE